jgi:hypothetical protein
MLIDCLPPESPLWHRGRGSIRAERHNGFQDVDQWAKNKEGAALPFGSAQDKKDAAVRLNLMPKNEKGGRSLDRAARFEIGEESKRDSSLRSE